MLNLTQGMKLQTLLAGAISTTECPQTVTYEEMNDASRGTKKTVDGISTGGTAIDLLLGSSGGRKITSFSFHNADSASVTVTVRLYNAAGTTRIIRKATLLTGEGLYWDTATGWYSQDASGNRKTSSAAADSSNISVALSVGSVGSSQASSVAALTPASVSSQASSVAALTPASVSSQASSVAALNPNTVSSLQSGASAQSFTSTNWATVSSAVSRTKSSFAW